MLSNALGKLRTSIEDIIVAMDVVNERKQAEETRRQHQKQETPGKINNVISFQFLNSDTGNLLQAQQN